MTLVAPALIDSDTARTLIAFCTLVVTVLGIVLPVMAFRSRRDIKAVRTQVENNHRDPETGQPINMREEADERHTENAQRLENISKVIIGMQGDVQAVRGELADLWKVLRRQGDELHDLEHTIPKSTPQPRRRTR